jgi:hypothetical protein
MGLCKMTDQTIWDSMLAKLITDLTSYAHFCYMGGMNWSLNILRSAEKMLRILLSEVVMPRDDDPENLLVAVNGAGSHVYKCYQPNKRLGHLWLQGVYWLLQGCAASDLVSTLTALQPSLVVWITDGEDCTTAQEYNHRVC